MSGEKKESLNDVWLGIGAVFLGYLLSLFLLFGGIVPILFITPILHIAAIVISFSRGRNRLGQGLLIGLGFVFLLVAACFGIIAKL